MLYEIKAFCRAKEISWNRFGKMSVGDGRLVFQMEEGRQLGEYTAERVNAFIAQHADTVFEYPTISPTAGTPRGQYNPNLLPYLGSDDWQNNIARGSGELLKAIAREHPDRVAA